MNCTLLELGHYACGIIGRAVVYDDNLVGWARLPQDTHNRFGQKARLIKGGNDDCNGRTITQSAKPLTLVSPRSLVPLSIMPENAFQLHSSYKPMNLFI